MKQVNPYGVNWHQYAEDDEYVYYHDGCVIKTSSRPLFSANHVAFQRKGGLNIYAFKLWDIMGIGGMLGHVFCGRDGIERIKGWFLDRFGSNPRVVNKLFEGVGLWCRMIENPKGGKGQPAYIAEAIDQDDQPKCLICYERAVKEGILEHEWVVEGAEENAKK